MSSRFVTRGVWLAAFAAAWSATPVHAQRVIGAAALTRTPLQFNNGTSGGYIFTQPALVTVGTGSTFVRPNVPFAVNPTYPYLNGFGVGYGVPVAVPYAAPFYPAFGGYSMLAPVLDAATPGGTVDPAQPGAQGYYDPAAPGRTFDPASPRFDPLLLPLTPSLTQNAVAYSAPVQPAPVGPTTDPSTAVITLNVPDGAYVYVQGQQTRQSGTQREFVSPPLAPGKNYTYDVKVQWTENDKPAEQTFKVAVRAGDRKSVNVFEQTKVAKITVTP
jgi:uncharacterized protein (TIGR03000 family)